MKTKNLLLSLLATLALGAASLPAAQAGPADEAYFRQFLYKVVKPNVSYRYLGNTMPLALPQADGTTIDVLMTLFLLDTGELVFKYQEMKNFFPVHQDEIDALWSVPDTDLVVADFAIGRRAVKHGQHAVELEFTQDLNSPGLKGQKIIVDYLWSNIGLGR